MKKIDSRGVSVRKKDYSEIVYFFWMHLGVVIGIAVIVYTTGDMKNPIANYFLNAGTQLAFLLSFYGFFYFKLTTKWLYAKRKDDRKY